MNQGTRNRLNKWSWTRMILVDLAIVTFIAAITGVAVHTLLHGFDLAMSDNLLVHGILPAFVYTAIMLHVQWASGYLAHRHIPLLLPRHVVAHVGIQSATTLLSFGLATVVLFAFYQQFLPDGGTGPSVRALMIIAIVAFLASLICNTVFYLIRFYKRVRASEQAAIRAELQALKAQINPHFLFNSLNSVAALVRTNPEAAEKVIENLAELFRYSLHATQRGAVTLGDEIESVDMYLAIEKARFPDRMTVKIEMPQELVRVQMPPLIVQPLVENAVKHGVSTVDHSCTVRINIFQEGERLKIHVTDTGPGFDHTDIPTILARGHGLANVQKRLEYLFGRSSEMTIMPDGVEIAFPVHI